MKSEDFFELLLNYYNGYMSKMELSDRLKLSFSQLKIYLEEIEKVIVGEYKIIKEVR